MRVSKTDEPLGEAEEEETGKPPSPLVEGVRVGEGVGVAGMVLGFVKGGWDTAGKEVDGACWPIPKIK